MSSKVEEQSRLLEAPVPIVAGVQARLEVLSGAHSCVQPVLVLPRDPDLHLRRRGPAVRPY